MDPSTDSVDAKQYDVVWKVVLIGNSGVGKTNFLTQYAWNQFTLDSKTTIGIDFACKDAQFEEKRVRLQIWDTAGQDRFRVLSQLYYNRALAVIIMYDITKHTSFQDVKDKWLKEVRETPGMDDPLLILVGNKYDLRHLRIVPIEEAERLAESEKMHFFEASAMDDYNIDEIFKLVVDGVGKNEKLKALREPAPKLAELSIKLDKSHTDNNNMKFKKKKKVCSSC